MRPCMDTYCFVESPKPEKRSSTGEDAIIYYVVDLALSETLIGARVCSDPAVGAGFLTRTEPITCLLALKRSYSRLGLLT